MKKRICSVIAVWLCLICAAASAAMDNSAFVQAQKSVTIDTKNPMNNGENITVTFSDMQPNMFFQGFCLGIDGEPSTDSTWEMYTSDAYPSIIRWVDDGGNTIQIDLSEETPLSVVMYAPAGEASVMIYDSANSKIYEMTPSGQTEVAFDSVEKWVGCTLGERTDGTKSFGVVFMDMKDILSARQATSSEQAEEAEECSYTSEQFVGNWHCREAKRILRVTLNDVWLINSVGGRGFNKPFELSGDHFIVKGLGTFRIEDADGRLQLVCVKSSEIAKDTVFVLEEDVISMEELTAQSWINRTAGEILTFENGEYRYSQRSGAYLGAISSINMVGDTIYLPGTNKEFTIVRDGEFFKLISETGEFVSAASPEAKPEHIQIDGLFVNESYHDKNHESMTQLVLCYTLKPTGKNIQAVGNNTTLTFEGGNSYQAGHIPKSCLYLGSYYYGSSYLKTVYYGEELKMVDTFAVPKAELAGGRAFTLKNRYVDGMEMFELNTDMVVSCKDMRDIAMRIDPEGYEKQAHALEEAGSKTKEKIRGYVNGYRWDFFVNNTSYSIEFAKNTYKLQSLGLQTKGKYTICNDYIILTNDATGAKNYIPYTIKNGDIDLDVAAGFDVKEN